MERLTSILLVDDEQVTAFLNKLLFKRAYIKNELLVAKNGLEAINLLKQKIGEQSESGRAVPNLILLDLNMPIMDGFGFLNAFQELEFRGKEAVVIIMLTTFLSPEDKEIVKQAGVKDFINKPLTGTAINEIVQKYFIQD